MSQSMCPCGRPLHYKNLRVRELVEEEIAAHGDRVPMRFPAGIRERTFLVPRHYLALHGINLEEAVKMGFEEVKR